MSTSRLRRVAMAIMAAGALATAPLVGDASAGAAAGPAPVGLCTVSGQVTGVVVTRGRPMNVTRFTFPARSVGSDQAAVRALARALCALPVMPRGEYLCPIDWGFTYRLVFSIGRNGGGSAAVTSVRPVVVDPSGCNQVTGLGRERRIVGESFFRTLGAAIGLSHATAATFDGALVSG